MNTVDALKAARAKIENPENWTQREYARDSQGRGVFYLSEEARCFCALGAIYATAPLDPSVRREAALRLELAVEPRSVATFNDHSSTTHADVLAAYDRAIVRAEEDES